MSSKRSHDDSEEPPSSKRQLSQLEIAIEIEEKLKSNKRKVDSIGAVNCETHPKSPKKSSVQADRESREVDYVEIIDDVAETLKTVTNEVVPIIRSLPSVPSPVRSDTRVHRETVVAPKVPTLRVNTSIEDDQIKPHAPIKPRLHSAHVTATATDENMNISINRGVMSNQINQTDDELSKLWSQICIAMDTCITTVTPLFITIILMLYLVSAISKSQTVASIGLVYVFVFHILLFSFFAAIVPFILVSNALCSLLAQQGQAPRRDFVRLAVLVCVIGVTVGYFKHGSSMN